MKFRESLTEEQRIKALADYLEIDPSEIHQEYDNEFSTPVGDYLVLDEDEAYEAAVQDIKDLYDDIGLESFTPNFVDWIMDNAVNESWFEEWLEQENEWAEENGEEIIEDENPMQLFRDLYGDEDFYNTVKREDLVDLDVVADEAISQDGIAHFIARYDGDEIDLGNGLYAYRTN